MLDWGSSLSSPWDPHAHWLREYGPWEKLPVITGAESRRTLPLSGAAPFSSGCMVCESRTRAHASGTLPVPTHDLRFQARNNR